MARRPLTVLIPTGNEIAHVDAVLDSVAWADEVLVVDSFSTDGTAEVARRRADRVLQREYGYSASQKNWAIPQAAHEWILLLDADERVTPALRAEIESVLSREELPERSFWIRRDNRFLGARVRFSGWGRDRVVRLFRRDCRYADRRVHAEIENGAPCGTLRAPLVHHAVTDLDAWVRKQDRYSAWKAEMAFARGVRPRAWRFLLEPAWRFLQRFLVQGGILDGPRGWIISAVEARSVWRRYVLLRALWRAQGGPS